MLKNYSIYYEIGEGGYVLKKNGKWTNKTIFN